MLDCCARVLAEPDGGVSGEAFARTAQSMEIRRRVFGDVPGEGLYRMMERWEEEGVAFSRGVEDRVCWRSLETCA